MNYFNVSACFDVVINTFVGSAEDGGLREIFKEGVANMENIIERLGVRQSQEIMAGCVEELGHSKEFYDEHVPVEISEAFKLSRDDLQGLPLYRYLFSIAYLMIYLLTSLLKDSGRKPSQYCIEEFDTS